MQKDMNIYSYSCVTSQLRNSAFPVSDSRYQTKCAWENFYFLYRKSDV